MKFEIEIPDIIGIKLKYLIKIGFSKSISDLILQSINLLLEKFRLYLNDFDSWKELCKKLNTKN